MGLMGTCSTGHVSITAADDADGADANRFSGFTADCGRHLFGALAGSYAGHEHEVGSAGKVEEPKRSSSHGTGPQAHPVWAHPIRARRHSIRQRLLLCTAGDLVSTVKAAGSELSYQQRNRNGRGA